MQRIQKVRLISKRARTTDESLPKPTTPVSKEKDIKRIVSGWVSEHRLRSQQLQRTFATLFQTPDPHVPAG
jgi:hypothetical protein